MIAEISDHCHISTNATINGSVKIKSKCFIGSNVTTKNNIKIKENSFIKAAGVNHNGSLDLAKKLIDAASIPQVLMQCKFQTFKAINLATKSSQKAIIKKKPLTKRNPV
jgi:sialic acid synthase SpsE